MKIKIATIALFSLCLCAVACHKQAPPSQISGQSHALIPSASPGGQLTIQAASAAPAPDWWWLEGCWYWNGYDWEWLSQKWMPPGGQMDYVGPAYSREDYCVYTQPETRFVAAAMPWPPDVSYGRSRVYVVQHGAYGTRRHRRRPQQHRDHRTPTRDRFYDHRRPRPRPEQPEPPDRHRWPDHEPVVEIGPAARPERPRPPRSSRPESSGRITPGSRMGPASRPPGPPPRHRPVPTRPVGPAVAPQPRPPRPVPTPSRITRPGPRKAAPKPPAAARPVHRPRPTAPRMAPPRSAPPRSAPRPRAAAPKSAPPPRAAAPKSAPRPRSAPRRKR